MIYVSFSALSLGQASKCHTWHEIGLFMGAVLYDSSACSLSPGCELLAYTQTHPHTQGIVVSYAQSVPLLLFRSDRLDWQSFVGAKFEHSKYSSRCFCLINTLDFRSLSEVGVGRLCFAGIALELTKKTSVHATRQGNARPQSSQFAEPLWTDP